MRRGKEEVERQLAETRAALAEAAAATAALQAQVRALELGGGLIVGQRAAMGWEGFEFFLREVETSEAVGMRGGRCVCGVPCSAPWSRGSLGGRSSSEAGGRAWLHVVPVPACRGWAPSLAHLLTPLLGTCHTNMYRAGVRADDSAGRGARCAG